MLGAARQRPPRPSLEAFRGATQMILPGRAGAGGWLPRGPELQRPQAARIPCASSCSGTSSAVRNLRLSGHHQGLPASRQPGGAIARRSAHAVSTAASSSSSSRSRQGRTTPLAQMGSNGAIPQRCLRGQDTDLASCLLGCRWSSVPREAQGPTEEARAELFAAEVDRPEQAAEEVGLAAGSGVHHRAEPPGLRPHQRLHGSHSLGALLGGQQLLHAAGAGPHAQVAGGSRRGEGVGVRASGHREQRVWSRQARRRQQGGV